MNRAFVVPDKNACGLQRQHWISCMSKKGPIQHKYEYAPPNSPLSHHPPHPSGKNYGPREPLLAPVTSAMTKMPR